MTLLLMTLLLACGPEGPQVVVYTSLDQRFSEPVLRAFEEQSGIEVRAVYDTEATKTTGLGYRLLAERGAPIADVFWNSEVLRTIVLKRAGVLAPYRSPVAEEIPAGFRDPEGYWTGFAARVRVIAVNTENLPEEEWPRRLEDLAGRRWRGRVALAYPLFGTTSTHVAALYSVWGPERTERWLRALVENDAQVVDGNSTARDRVVAGAVDVALTDTDDAAVARRQGKPLAMLFPDAEGLGALVIPNTVALIAGAPHRAEAERLIDYLVSAEVERQLASADGAQIPLREGAPWPDALPPRASLTPMQIDFDSIAEHLEASIAFSRDLFVR